MNCSGRKELLMQGVVLSGSEKQNSPKSPTSLPCDTHFSREKKHGDSKKKLGRSIKNTMKDMSLGIVSILTMMTVIFFSLFIKYIFLYF